MGPQKKQGSTSSLLILKGTKAETNNGKVCTRSQDRTTENNNDQKLKISQRNSRRGVHRNARSSENIAFLQKLQSLSAAGRVSVSASGSLGFQILQDPLGSNAERNSVRSSSTRLGTETAHEVAYTDTNIQIQAKRIQSRTLLSFAVGPDRYCREISAFSAKRACYSHSFRYTTFRTCIYFLVHAVFYGIVLSSASAFFPVGFGKERRWKADPSVESD